MKCLSLFSDQWTERLRAKFSDEEKKIIQHQKDEDAIRSIFKNFQQRGNKLADFEDARLAQTVYDKNKIKDSELIMANIILPSLHGEIICRVGEDIKRVRF